ncbi:MAG: MBL fold metallo-hydrolase [Ornithinimicrobium sp.]|uniref:MBL fold metallo-hydrolase n=1 Tax=Ornithinimicrobium sp. TaxID=1977084 RepID=UPI003D9BDFED
MILQSVTAAAFGTNCYVVAVADGEECLIVDPGIGVEEPVREILLTRRLRPAAVLLTHGHLDHVYAVTPLCSPGVAAHIHPEDRYRLADPLAQLDPALVAMVEQQFGTRATWQEPSDIVELGTSGDTALELAGLRLSVTHTPGHTEGSVLFSLADVPQGTPDELHSTVLSGDVLFAGSIGRTDLPGGDHQAMLRSLREQVLPLPDSTLVLPGHGPATTMARERSTNPFLAGLG